MMAQTCVLCKAPVCHVDGAGMPRSDLRLSPHWKHMALALPAPVRLLGDGIHVVLAGRDRHVSDIEQALCLLSF